MPRRGLDEKMLKQIRWNLREEAKSLPPFDECPTPQHLFLMNIIIWNCGGTLKPSFQIIEKARDISSRLPFDGATHTNTIGYAGGLWMLCNSNRVEVTTLSSTEQEIHVVVKVISSSSSWLFTVVYASHRSAKRHILWDNLNKLQSFTICLGL